MGTLIKGAVGGRNQCVNMKMKSVLKVRKKRERERERERERMEEEINRVMEREDRGSKWRGTEKEK